MLTVSLDGQYDALLANAVCPGWVRTDMGERDAAKSPAEGADTPVWLARFGRGSPSGLFWAEREVVEW